MQQSFAFAVQPSYALYRLADMRRGTTPLMPAIFSIFDDGSDDEVDEQATRIERSTVKLGIS